MSNEVLMQARDHVCMPSHTVSRDIQRDLDVNMKHLYGVKKSSERFIERTKRTLPRRTVSSWPVAVSLLTVAVKYVRTVSVYTHCFSQ